MNFFVSIMSIIAPLNGAKSIAGKNVKAAAVLIAHVGAFKSIRSVKIAI
jgi:hypothetical protein